MPGSASSGCSPREIRRTAGPMAGDPALPNVHGEGAPAAQPGRTGSSGEIEGAGGRRCPARIAYGRSCRTWRCGTARRRSLPNDVVVLLLRFVTEGPPAERLLGTRCAWIGRERGDPRLVHNGDGR